MRIVSAACLLLAALTLLMPSAPTTDPWGWIVWGRELAHLDLATSGGPPSWKPLPVLITTPLSLAGDAAPALWLLTARAGALLALVVAYRLAARLGGVAAGVVAAAGLAFSGGWIRSFEHGYSEPLAVGLLLLAAERHLDGRPRHALLLGALVALVRPEALPLVALYGVLGWRQGAVTGRLVAGAVAGVAALWVVPDWIASGHLLNGRSVASGAVSTKVHYALRDGLLVAPVPLSVLALAGPLRERTGPLRVLVGVALGWAAYLVLLILAGYPPSARFFALPAGLLCVAGAVGGVRLVEAVPSARRRALAGAAAALLMAVTLAPRAAGGAVEVREGVRRAPLERDLVDLLESAGPRRLARCGELVLPRGLAWTRGLVAWKLGLHLREVGELETSARGHILALTGTHRPPRPLGREEPVAVEGAFTRSVLLAPFGTAPVHRRGERRSLPGLASAGRWRAVAASHAACGQTGPSAAPSPAPRSPEGPGPGA